MKNNDNKLMQIIRAADVAQPTSQDIKKIISLIDLTSLNADDNYETIAALCQRAVNTQGTVASICIYPQFVKFARKKLDEAKAAVKVAAVVNFPHGNARIAEVMRDADYAIHAGAQEIDLVMPYQGYLEGEKLQACQLIEECK